jgi:hypothetical protein
MGGILLRAPCVKEHPPEKILLLVAQIPQGRGSPFLGESKQSTSEGSGKVEPMTTTLVASKAFPTVGGFVLVLDMSRFVYETRPRSSCCRFWRWRAFSP